MSEAAKFDADKAPWHLLPTDAVRCVVRVLGFGAARYQERNWETGLDWSRVYAALQRHLTAWWEGERYDPDSGMPHLWHVATNALFLVAYEMRGVGKDDRPAQTVAQRINAAWQAIPETATRPDSP